MTATSPRAAHALPSLNPAVGRVVPAAANRPWETGLVVALLCVSGNTAALRPVGHEATYAIGCVCLVVLALLCGRIVRVITIFPPVALIFTALCVIQGYAFDFFPVTTVLGFLVRLLIGASVMAMVSDFPRRYVGSMVGVSLLSFVFWIPEYVAVKVGLNFHSVFSAFAAAMGPQEKDRWSLGFHTYLTAQDGLGRNCGMFWEPGAFAGYIILALLMLAAIRASITRKQHLAAFVILTIALVSTTSTTGYIAYPIAFLLNLNTLNVKAKLKVSMAARVCLLVPVVILGSWLAFQKLEFLQAKVKRQITAVQRREYRWRSNRFGTLVFDWEYIKTRPLTGWGLHDKTRFALHPWVKDDGFGNGMSNFIVRFGFIGFGTFVLGVLRGAKHIGGGSAVYAGAFAVCTLLLLQGETFLGFPLFLGLIFLSKNQLSNNKSLKSSYSSMQLHRTSDWTRKAAVA